MTKLGYVILFIIATVVALLIVFQSPRSVCRRACLFSTDQAQCASLCMED